MSKNTRENVYSKQLVYTKKKDSPSMKISLEAQERLRRASVPSAFKEAVKKVTPGEITLKPAKPAHPLLKSIIEGPFISTQSITSNWTPENERHVWKKEFIASETKIPEHNTESFKLTDMSLNLNGVSDPTHGLIKLANTPLYNLVTNTYCTFGEMGGKFFQEGNGYPGEEICYRPAKKTPCKGFYITFMPANMKLVLLFVKQLAACGLSVKLVSRPNDVCRRRVDVFTKDYPCCRERGVLTSMRVELVPGAPIPRSMVRIAHMIEGTLRKKSKSAFCIEINPKPATIDWYSRAPREESQLNPNFVQRIPVQLPGMPRPKPNFKGFFRTRCDLLAHVITENYWGQNCYWNHLNANLAHALALMEENWIRSIEGRPLMQGKKGLPTAKQVKAGLKKFDKGKDKAQKRKRF